MAWEGRGRSRRSPYRSDYRRSSGGRDRYRGRSRSRSRSYSPYGGRRGGGDYYRRDRRPRERSGSPGSPRGGRDRGRDRGRREDRELPYRRSASRSPVRDSKYAASGRRREEGEGNKGSGSGPSSSSAKQMAASLENEFFETGFDEEQEAMMKMMGFGSFNTTQGEKVKGNAAGFAKVKSTRQARQFMNRKGGFNRPLPAERTGQKLNDR